MLMRLIFPCLLLLLINSHVKAQQLRTGFSLGGYKAALDIGEGPTIGYTFGAHLDWPLARKLTLNTSITYNRSTHTIIGTLPYCNPGMNLPNNQERIMQFEHINVPITLQYLLLDKKIDLSVIAGAGLSFHLPPLNTETITCIDTIKFNYGVESYINRPNWEAIIGLTAEIPLGHRHLLHITPFYSRTVRDVLQLDENSKLSFAGVILKITWPFYREVTDGEE